MKEKIKDIKYWFKEEFKIRIKELTWLENFLILVGICALLYIFMLIFYPEAFNSGDLNCHRDAMGTICE